MWTSCLFEMSMAQSLSNENTLSSCIFFLQSISIDSAVSEQYVESTKCHKGHDAQFGRMCIQTMVRNVLTQNAFLLEWLTLQMVDVCLVLGTYSGKCIAVLLLYMYAELNTESGALHQENLKLIETDHSIIIIINLVQCK